MSFPGLDILNQDRKRYWLNKRGKLKISCIFNSKRVWRHKKISLYECNLIECNDFTFTVATIPSWAMEEAKNLIGKDFKGTGWNDSLVSGSKKAIKLKNQYDHPTLYEKTMKCFTQEG